MSTEKENTKTLTGKDVLLIKKTRIVKLYKTETEGYKGKKFRIFASGANAFVVHEDDEQSFEEGLKASGDNQIAEVQFTVTDDGWSLVNWLTWGQLNSLKSNQVKNEAITVEAFMPQSVRAYEELA